MSHPLDSLLRAVAPAALSVLLVSCAGQTAEGSSQTTPRASSSGAGASGQPAGGSSSTTQPPAGATTHTAPPPASGSASPYAVEYARATTLETLDGRASYYSDRLAGRSTASGEPYRTTEFTAASRDLRFGTILRVTRTDTGAVTYVRVNDRGPFGDRRRIIDLSRAAAEELDMIRAGVVDVRVEIVHRPSR
ncbi:MAG: septal ring lytic transglycosylase RlpA family protein [Sandaracinaceae bacterium]|nr:septal ring lytic transglycosylase RlpA family protein [Sandaracinaceae bacterium]